jgi:glycogen synthase
MLHTVTLLNSYCSIMATKLYSARHKVFVIHKKAWWGIWWIGSEAILSLCHYMWLNGTPYLNYSSAHHAN